MLLVQKSGKLVFIKSYTPVHFDEKGLIKGDNLLVCLSIIFDWYQQFRLEVTTKSQMFYYYFFFPKKCFPNSFEFCLC